jgi:eukaryotic-like serine/threonine-protein kinase
MMIRYLLPILLLGTFTLGLGQSTDRLLDKKSPLHSREYQTKWIFKTGGKIFGSPVIIEKTMFIGSGDGHLYALNTGDGTVKWKFRSSGPIHSTVTCGNGNVYFGSFDGHYYALDASTGKKVWAFKTGGEKWMGGVGYLGLKPDSIHMDDPWEFYLSSPTLNPEGSTLYFGSSDKNLYAVNAVDGSLKWKFTTEGIIHSAPFVHGNTVLVGGWDTFLYAVDATTGKLQWKFKTGSQVGMSGIQASPVVDNGTVYIGARDANFYAINVSNGELRWKFFADNAWILSDAMVNDGTVYFGTSDTFLVVALDAATGKEKWNTPLNGYVFSSPTLSGESLYVGDFTGKLYALRQNSGEIVGEFSTPGSKAFGGSVLNNGKLDFMKLAEGKDASQYAVTVAIMNEFYRLGPIVASPVITNGTAYVGSSDGYVYAIDITTL